MLTHPLMKVSRTKLGKPLISYCQIKNGSNLTFPWWNLRLSPEGPDHPIVNCLLAIEEAPPVTNWYAIPAFIIPTREDPHESPLRIGREGFKRMGKKRWDTRRVPRREEQKREESESLWRVSSPAFLFRWKTNMHGKLQSLIALLARIARKNHIGACHGWGYCGQV